MTNLTDEGLRELARKALGIKEWDIWGTQKEQTVTSALQQVRDAAKKEEMERCAKVAESDNYLMILTKDTLGDSERSAKIRKQMRKEVATAIRQMGGGK